MLNKQLKTQLTEANTHLTKLDNELSRITKELVNLENDFNTALELINKFMTTAIERLNNEKPI